PEGLADRVDVDARGGLLGEARLQQVGGAAGELDVLEPPGHLAHRDGQHLAVLRRDGRRHLSPPLRAQLPEPEQDGRPLPARRAPRAAAVCGDDGRVEVVRRRPRGGLSVAARRTLVPSALALALVVAPSARAGAQRTPAAPPAGAISRNVHFVTNIPNLRAA